MDIQTTSKQILQVQKQAKYLNNIIYKWLDIYDVMVLFLHHIWIHQNQSYTAISNFQKK